LEDQQTWAWQKGLKEGVLSTSNSRTKRPKKGFEDQWTWARWREAYTWIRRMNAWKSIGWVHKQEKQVQQNWQSRPNTSILQTPTQAHHMIKKGVIPINMKRYLQQISKQP